MTSCITLIPEAHSWCEFVALYRSLLGLLGVCARACARMCECMPPPQHTQAINIGQVVSEPLANRTYRFHIYEDVVN